MEMKYLLCRNVMKINDGDEDNIENRKYLKRIIPDKWLEELYDYEFKLQKENKWIKISRALWVVRTFWLILSLACIKGIIEGYLMIIASGRSLVQALQRNILLECIVLLIMGVNAIFFLLDRRVVRAVDHDTAAFEIRIEKEKVEHRIEKFINSPRKKKKVDILSFSYQNKGTTIEIINPVNNNAAYIYSQDGFLSLALNDRVYAVPLNRLKAIHIIRKKISLAGWNKNDNPDQIRYKKAGLVLEGDKGMALDYFCALEWMDDGEKWPLFFPAYERQAFTELTKLQLSNDNARK